MFPPLSAQFLTFDISISPQFLTFDISISPQFLPFDISISPQFLPFDIFNLTLCISSSLYIMSMFDRIYSLPPGSKASSITDDSIPTPRKVKSGDSDTCDNSSSSRARSDSHPDSQDPGSNQVPDPSPGSQALTLQLTQMASCIDDSRVQSLNDLGDMYGAFEKTYKDLRGSVELQNRTMSDIVEQMNNIKDHYQRIDTEREHHQRNLEENFPDVARKVFRQKPFNRHRINSTLTPPTPPTINKSKKRRGSHANQHSPTEPKRRKEEEDCVILDPSSIVPTKFTTLKQRRS